MTYEHTLFLRLRIAERFVHARRSCSRSFTVAATAAVLPACTQRSQLVAKVRASPNNGFPHEEQIGGTIYLSGALANVCILTREPPQIFNLRAH